MTLELNSMILVVPSQLGYSVLVVILNLRAGLRTDAELQQVPGARAPSAGRCGALALQALRDSRHAKKQPWVCFPPRLQPFKLKESNTNRKAQSPPLLVYKKKAAVNVYFFS